MIVVSNSSPLIALSHIGQLALLRSLYSKLFIPQAVYDEVVRAEEDRPGSTEVFAAEWIEIQKVKDQTAVLLLREQLDQGESEAIVLALEAKAQVLLIDEARGRRIAQSRGLPHIGTVGVLVLAKRQGLIKSATSLLDELSAVGFRMSPQLYSNPV
jgi:uncharacterized protein